MIPTFARRDLEREAHAPYQTEADGRESRSEIVRAGSWFPLFPLDRTDTRPARPDDAYPEVTRYSSRILLDAEDLPLFPVLFSLIPSWKSRTQAFTPCEPARGYHVDARDLVPETRLTKLAAYHGNGFNDIPGHPLLFGASADARDLVDLGLVERDPRGLDRYRFQPDVYRLVTGLRLHMEVNGLRLASEPEWGELQSGDIVYHSAFYPLDTGPLAVPDGYQFILMPGLLVAFPDDPAQLATITGRFTLTPTV